MKIFTLETEDRNYSQLDMELLFFKKPNTCDFTATPFRTGPAQENTFYKFSLFERRSQRWTFTATKPAAEEHPRYKPYGLPAARWRCGFATFIHTDGLFRFSPSASF